jgi:hypothetical protein
MPNLIISKKISNFIKNPKNGGNPLILRKATAKLQKAILENSKISII